MNKFFIIFLFLVGCSATGVTRHGTKWVAPAPTYITTHQVEAVIDITVTVFERETGHTVEPHILKQIENIYFVRFPLNCSSGQCSGLAYSDRVYVVIKDSCLAHTSLVHEYLHVITTGLGLRDYEHEDPRFFEIASGRDSIEYMAEQAALVVCE